MRSEDCERKGNNCSNKRIRPWLNSFSFSLDIKSGNEGAPVSDWVRHFVLRNPVLFLPLVTPSNSASSTLSAVTWCILITCRSDQTMADTWVGTTDMSVLHPTVAANGRLIVQTDFTLINIISYSGQLFQLEYDNNHFISCNYEYLELLRFCNVMKLQLAIQKYTIPHFRKGHAWNANVWQLFSPPTQYQGQHSKVSSKPKRVRNFLTKKSE